MKPLLSRGSVAAALQHHESIAVLNAQREAAHAVAIALFALTPSSSLPHTAPCVPQNEADAYRNIRLRVEEVQGRNCLTQFHGMDLTTDKLRSLVRKWQTLIEATVDVKTTDGYFLRLFCISFTKKRPGQVKKTAYAQSSQVRGETQRATRGRAAGAAGGGAGRQWVGSGVELGKGLRGRAGGYRAVCPAIVPHTLCCPTIRSCIWSELLIRALPLLSGLQPTLLSIAPCTFFHLIHPLVRADPHHPRQDG